MSNNNELSVYKKNRINDLTNIYNTNISRLYSTAVMNIRNIQNSRQTIKIKKIQLINLINQYNANLNSEKNLLNLNITRINNFIPQQIISTKNKRALLIGINYIGTQYELNGCINDVDTIKNKISNSGFKDINILTDLTVKKPTKENILSEFKNLLINSQAGDLLLFFYSGHGSNTLDNNNDESDGLDEMLVSSDLQGIIDDDLKNIIQTNLKENISLFAMFDSCFSGTVLDLKYQYLDSLNYDNYTENSKQLETKGNVLMISGSSDNQTSVDAVFNNIPNGALTWSFSESLEQNKNKPQLSWRELVKSMRDLLKKSSFSQIPQLSSGQFADIDNKIFL
jgi:metacaspase-1